MNEELQSILAEEKAPEQETMDIGRTSQNPLRKTYKPWYKDFGCTGHSWKKNLWRIINGLFALLFACAAVLQWNDPDTHLWLIVYMVPCLLSLGVTIWAQMEDVILWKVIALLHILGCLAGIVYISIKYGAKISEAHPHITSIEEGWELCGLLFVVCWLIVASIVASYRHCKEWFMKSITNSRAPSCVTSGQSSNFEVIQCP